MQPHEKFTVYHTFDLTEAHIHILTNPRRLVALVPKTWEKVNEPVKSMSGVMMQGYLVTAWDEILVKNLEEV